MSKEGYDNVQESLPELVPSAIETGLLKGDIGKLSPEERSQYYLAICKSTGLNPLTRPFILMRDKNNEQFFYCTKEGAEQVRHLHKVSFERQEKEIIGDVLIVTVYALLPDGRREQAMGAVDIGSLKGVGLANAYMRAESKAKRRCTLAICGLGFSDVEDSVGQPVEWDYKTGEILSDPPPDTVQNDFLIKVEDLLREQGVDEEGISAFWDKQEKRYKDGLSPKVIAKIYEGLLKRVKQKEEEQVKTVPLEEERADYDDSDIPY